MAQPILAGYDPDHHDDGPVRFAAAASSFTGASLVVASAYPESRAGGTSVPAEEEAAPLEALLTQLGVPGRIIAVAGRSAPAALHTAAEDLGAALLVVGSTRHGRAGVVHPGSTAERLLHGAPCPLAVVPAGWQAGGGLQTIGAAYVDTPEGRAAIEAATLLARHAAARLRVLAAVHPRHFGREEYDSTAGEVTTFDSVGRHEDEARRRALNLVGDVAGLEVEMDVSAQDAATFLVAASENVDLLICGSRGYGPRRAVLLGGVTRHVVRESRCPVIVLARGTETRLSDLLGSPEPVTA